MSYYYYYSDNQKYEEAASRLGANPTEEQIAKEAETNQLNPETLKQRVGEMGEEPQHLVSPEYGKTQAQIEYARQRNPKVSSETTTTQYKQMSQVLLGAKQAQTDRQKTSIENLGERAALLQKLGYTIGEQTEKGNIPLTRNGRTGYFNIYSGEYFAEIPSGKAKVHEAFISKPSELTGEWAKKAQQQKNIAAFEADKKTVEDIFNSPTTPWGVKYQNIPPAPKKTLAKKILENPLNKAILSGAKNLEDYTFQFSDVIAKPLDLSIEQKQEAFREGGEYLRRRRASGDMTNVEKLQNVGITSGYLGLTVLKGMSYPYRHPVQTARGAIQYLLLPAQPMKLVDTGIQLAEDVKAQPIEGISNFVSPMLGIAAPFKIKSEFFAKAKPVYYEGTDSVTVGEYRTTTTKGAQNFIERGFTEKPRFLLGKERTGTRASFKKANAAVRKNVYTLDYTKTQVPVDDGYLLTVSSGTKKIVTGELMRQFKEAGKGKTTFAREKAYAEVQPTKLRGAALLEKPALKEQPAQLPETNIKPILKQGTRITKGFKQRVIGAVDTTRKVPSSTIIEVESIPIKKSSSLSSKPRQVVSPPRGGSLTSFSAPKRGEPWVGEELLRFNKRYENVLSENKAVQQSLLKERMQKVKSEEQAIYGKPKSELIGFQMEEPRIVKPILVKPLPSQESANKEELRFMPQEIYIPKEEVRPGMRLIEVEEPRKKRVLELPRLDITEIPERKTTLVVLPQAARRDTTEGVKIGEPVNQEESPLIGIIPKQETRPKIGQKISHEEIIISPGQQTPPPSTMFFNVPEQPVFFIKNRYAAMVRRKGRFIPVGIFSDAQKAFARGESIVKNTAAASFKVESSDALGLAKAAAQVTPSIFYRSKKERGVFIQRREKRISTAGEKAEISFKGIRALRKLF